MSERKYRPWPPGPATKALPGSYLAEMTSLVDQVTSTWFSQRDLDDGYADYVKARYVFGRMELCETRIMPWLTEAVPHLGSVLEIGCGNGSATVPLARRATHVHAFDLAADQVAIAAKRCNLLEIRNVTSFAKPVSWIDEYLADSSSLCGPVDTIVCYALFEHLLPLERIKLLIGAWQHLEIGGRLVVIETPNRLYFFDWHSSQIPFHDQLPPEIAFLWNGFSPRANLPNDLKAISTGEAKAGNVDRLYRFGRGASFHEFFAAIGPENFKVVNRSILDRREFPHWNQDYIDVIARQLKTISPEPHIAFAQPCLDLIIEKTGPSRMTS